METVQSSPLAPLTVMQVFWIERTVLIILFSLCAGTQDGIQLDAGTGTS